MFMVHQAAELTPRDVLYFADICAGPGGFTEYVLWRRQCRQQESTALSLRGAAALGSLNALNGGATKGFGFTLKGDCDFKLDLFLAPGASAEFFEPHYGSF